MTRIQSPLQVVMFFAMAVIFATWQPSVWRREWARWWFWAARVMAGGSCGASGAGGRRTTTVGRWVLGTGRGLRVCRDG